MASKLKTIGVGAGGPAKVDPTGVSATAFRGRPSWARPWRTAVPWSGRRIWGRLVAVYVRETDGRRNDLWTGPTRWRRPADAYGRTRPDEIAAAPVPRCALNPAEPAMPRPGACRFPPTPFRREESSDSVPPNVHGSDGPAAGSPGTNNGGRGRGLPRAEVTLVLIILARGGLGMAWGMTSPSGSSGRAPERSASRNGPGPPGAATPLNGPTDNGPTLIRVDGGRRNRYHRRGVSPRPRRRWAALLPENRGGHLGRGIAFPPSRLPPRFGGSRCPRSDLRTDRVAHRRPAAPCPAVLPGLGSPAR